MNKMSKIKLFIICCRYIPIATFATPWVCLFLFGQNNLKNNYLFGMTMLALVLSTLFIVYYLIPDLMHEYNKANTAISRSISLLTVGLYSLYLYWKILDPLLCDIEKFNKIKK